jgi:uncharacterized membrane protein YfcA
MTGGVWPIELVLVVAATFILAGLVKGVIGMGLPTIALAALTAMQGLGEAMVLLLVPSLVTNFWQACVGGAHREIFKRFWLFLLSGAVCTWFAVGLIEKSDAALLSGLLGVSVVIYAGYGLLGPSLQKLGPDGRGLSFIMGSMSGVLSGLTGSFTLPAVPYFQALALPRDFLIQLMGTWFTVATVVLGLALQRHELLPLNLGLLSAAAVGPAVIGMAVGQKIREKLSEKLFRKVMFGALLVLGFYITWGAVQAYLF